ncbi:tetratricopeptide repeat protein [Roseibium sp. RKSG952]|uniref:tetratricopeptide repeat protein n=1 Tax=Roseibium sp. RKSG952 TaxID=2529384 RepID=UPI0012BCF0BB|nr:SEL1-like repeat protein [Roseibium sp. RKSG952]MTH96687.1 hypothetical protein [Roseibium sp. RKSG952]
MAHEVNPKKIGFITVLSAALAALLLAGCQGGTTKRTNVYPVFPAEIAGPSRGEEDFEKGYVYQHGIGVPRNYSMAAEAYRASAMKGDARALNNLGVMAANGRGVPGGFERAENHFISAAKGGSAAAHFNLGLISETRGDTEGAFLEYRMAAEQGHASAQYRLADLLDDGSGGTSSSDEIRRLRHLAAANGDSDALRRLSSVTGSMNQAAARDHFASEYCSSCSSSFETDMSVRSISALEKLAMSGDMSARYNLGVRHVNGKGVVKDPSEAARHFTLAARAGHAPSQRQLAQMHMRGQAVAQSKILAHYWLNLASRQSSADGLAARNEMERLEITMSPEQVSEAQALSTHRDSIGR